MKDRTEKKPDVPFTKPPIEVNAMTFPPLLGAEETPIPTPGYKEDFIKYNMDELIVIVKNVKEAQLPSEVKAVSIYIHTLCCVAFRFCINHFISI